MAALGLYCINRGGITSTDQTDGTKEACFSIVHLQWQKLPSKRKDQVSKWPKSCIVHLCTVQSESIRECHRVLFWGITCADPEHLKQHCIKVFSI